VEASLTSDEVAVVPEDAASFCDDGVEISESFEVPVDDRLVDMGPEGLGGLEFRGVGRQVDEADTLGEAERCGVPAGAVEDEEDDPVAPGAGLAGEEGEPIVGKTIRWIVF
jgi:hypothetical protein